MEQASTSRRRMTRQRRLVLDIVQESQEHLDAEMIFERARRRDPRISLATVYRTLALLKETGQVQQHDLGEHHGHFEATDLRPHYHFTCLTCGRVIEFEAPQVMELAHGLCEEYGLRIVTTHLLLSGYCSNCQPEGSRCE